MYVRYKTGSDIEWNRIQQRYRFFLLFMAHPWYRVRFTLKWCTFNRASNAASPHIPAQTYSRAIATPRILSTSQIHNPLVPSDTCTSPTLKPNQTCRPHLTLAAPFPGTVRFLPDTLVPRIRRKDCRSDFLIDFTRDRGPSSANWSLGCNVHLTMTERFC